MVTVCVCVCKREISYVCFFFLIWLVFVYLFVRERKKGHGGGGWGGRKNLGGLKGGENHDQNIVSEKKFQLNKRQKENCYSHQRRR